MIKKISLEEFEDRFSFNEHRDYLFEILCEELKIIVSQCKRLRIVVFGSYITRKEKPGDIDILISLIPNKDSVYDLMKKGLDHRYPNIIDVQYLKTQHALKDSDSLIDFFNENPLNKEKGIFIDDAVELDIYRKKK